MRRSVETLIELPQPHIRDFPLTMFESEREWQNMGRAREDRKENKRNKIEDKTRAIIMIV